MLQRTTGRRTTGRRTAGLITALATAGSLLLVPSPAAAGDADPATVGLFGQQKPTFDGVYRQSLSLILLEAVEARIPATSVRWLKRQQCNNGSFMAYRSDVSLRCGFYDSNATATAAIALRRIGERKAAQAAVRWLIDQQKKSGGWMFSDEYPGPADANSTGLVIQALVANRIDPDDVARRKSGPEFLTTLQLDCDSELGDDRGGLDYQRQSPLSANDFATAQATAALAGASLPVRPRPTDVEWPTFTCDESPQPSPADAAAGYLARTLNENGGYLVDWKAAPDYGSTANAVLSLVAAGHGADQITQATETLQDTASEYVVGDSKAVMPARAAILGLTALATDGDPRAFGEVNTVRSILSSRTTAG